MDKDTIYRQSAIDALDKHLRSTDVPESYPGIISALTEWLNELPSVQPEQPEIVRCKDCKYLLPKGSFCSKDMCCLRGMAHYHNVDIHNDFCSWGEVEDE